MMKKREIELNAMICILQEIYDRNNHLDIFLDIDNELKKLREELSTINPL